VNNFLVEIAVLQGFTKLVLT